MMLRFAQKERPNELNLHDIGTRLVVANSDSFHKTSIAATNLIPSVLESNAEYNTISILREEISGVLHKFGSIWSRAAVAKMIHYDNFLRKNLRITAFGLRNLLRQVMLNNLHTEDSHLFPKGSDVSMLTFSIQTKGNLFEDPFIQVRSFPLLSYLRGQGRHH
jgi:hypothetical protein